MAFSQAQFQAAVDKINSGMSDLSGKIGQVIPAAQAGTDHWYIPGFVKDAVMWLAHEAVNIAESLWNKIVELLKGVAAPVLFFFDAFDWENVRGLATGVAGELSPTVMPSTQHWSGTAEQAYAKIIPPQAVAASRIGTISDSTAIALGICAVTGLAFYVALGIILAQFIVAMIATIAAVGSIAFSWAGVGIAVDDTTVSAGLIITAVVTLVGVLTAQAQQMVSLHGQATDNTAFPGGKWLDPNTASYNYAS
jgi:hypothetical protein